jgi:flagellar motor switch protein FliG
VTATASTVSNLTGPQKAALVILALEESVACELIRHLSEKELRRLVECVDSMSTLPTDQLDATFEDFDAQLRSPVPPRAGGEYLRKLTTSALGGERAQKLLEPPVVMTRPLDAIRSARAKTLADLLMEEHPQVAAVILSQLPREQAAAVLLELPADRQGDLLARIASLAEIPAQSLEVASEALARALIAAGGITDTATRHEFDGVAFAAALLNELPGKESERVLNALTELDGKIAPKVREAMFTFEDLSRLGVRDVQSLMREVSSETLLMALKTAGESMRELFLSAISSRAAEQMREDLSLMPPTRLSDVEAAQREVVECATRLASDGRITLPGSGSGEKMV